MEFALDARLAKEPQADCRLLANLATLLINVALASSFRHAPTVWQTPTTVINF
jgi:hypothetical protein